MEESSRRVQYWVAFAGMKSIVILLGNKAVFIVGKFKSLAALRIQYGDRDIRYPLVKYLLLMVSLASLTSSVSFSWTTPVIPKFHNNETVIKITDTEISWVIVASTPGLIVGTIATQYLSDNFGRRSSLLASAIPFGVGTMFILFTTKVWMLYIARFLWGVGAGVIQNVTMIYLAEIASKEIRGSLVVGSRFMFNFGGFLVVAIGSFVTYQTLSYMLIVLPAAYFFACWWISETPYYLLKESKVDAARKVLMKLNGYTDEKILEEKLTEMRTHVKEDMRRSSTVKELFTGKRYRKALIICFGLFSALVSRLRICQLMSGIIPIQQYLGRIMQDTKSSISVSTGLIFFAGLKFVICMISSRIVDRIGRRPLLISSYIGACLSLAVVGTAFFVHDVTVIEDHSELYGNVIFSGILCFSIISTFGFGTLTFVIPAEIFPLNVKSIAMTSINLFGSVVTFIIIRGYQIVKDLTGLYVVFWFFGVVCFVGAVFSYYVVPETKGKSLREIQLELQGPLYEEASEMMDLTKLDVEVRLMPKNQVEKMSAHV